MSTIYGPKLHAITALDSLLLLITTHTKIDSVLQCALHEVKNLVNGNVLYIVITWLKQSGITSCKWAKVHGSFWQLLFPSNEKGMNIGVSGRIIQSVLLSDTSLFCHTDGGLEKAWQMINLVTMHHDALLHGACFCSTGDILFIISCILKFYLIIAIIIISVISIILVFATYLFISFVFLHRY